MSAPTTPLATDVSNNALFPNTEVIGNISVNAGDLIVAFMVGFFNSGTDYLCEDDAGNVWSPAYLCNGGGFGHVAFSWAIANATGSIEVTFSDTSSQEKYMILATYPAWGDVGTPTTAPELSEICCNICPQYYTPVAPFTQGIVSNYFSAADSLVVTGVYVAGPVSTTLGSDTGDTEEAGPATFKLFNRAVLGPGDPQNVAIKAQSAVPPGQIMMINAVFSRPVPRPDGTDDFYALRPGAGWEAAPGNGTTPSVFFPNEINRPLPVTLPYRPELGWFLCVRVAQSAYGTSNPNVADDYGNVYTLRGRSANTGSGCIVSIYTCSVTALPPDEDAFILRLTCAGPYPITVYQATAIGVSAHNRPGTPSVQFAAFDNVTAGVVETEEIAVVPADALMLGMAAYSPSILEQAVTWTQDGPWEIRRKAGFIQTAAQQTNAARSGPAAIFDYIAPADGAYSATVAGTIDGSPILAAGIAMIAVVFLTTLEGTKVVVGGGDPEEWMITADGPSPQAGAGGFGPVEVLPGVYDLGESGGLPGYVGGPPAITGGTQLGPYQVQIAAGQAVSFVFTNTLGNQPCVDFEPTPETDSKLELTRVVATLIINKRMPVRGRA